MTSNHHVRETIPFNVTSVLSKLKPFDPLCIITRNLTKRTTITRKIYIAKKTDYLLSIFVQNDGISCSQKALVTTVFFLSMRSIFWWCCWVDKIGQLKFQVFHFGWVFVGMGNWSSQIRGTSFGGPIITPPPPNRMKNFRFEVTNFTLLSNETPPTPRPDWKLPIQNLNNFTTSWTIVRTSLTRNHLGSTILLLPFIPLATLSNVFRGDGKGFEV